MNWGINQLPNVKRKYVREIRAILHAWAKYGQKAAEQEHHSRYYKKHRFGDRKPSIAEIVGGKLAYLSMVRGTDDGVYARLETEFARVSGRAPRTLHGIPAVDLRTARAAVWVIEAESESSEEIVQGSGFMLDDVGLITCAHCVGKGTQAFKPPDTERRGVTVEKLDPDLDLAILSLDAVPGPRLREGGSTALSQLDPVYVLGYPEYAPGATVHLDVGHVTGWRDHFGTRRMIINTALVPGISGGPVLDAKYRVVGIAAKGRNESQGAYWNSVIPIERLRDIKPRASTETAS